MPFLAPVFGAIAAFAATPIGGLIVGFAIQAGVGLLRQWIKGDQQPKQQQRGTQLQMSFGDSNPLSFPIGYSASAGTLRYRGSWGQVGDVPNAYLTEVIQLSDLPVSGLNGAWAGPQRATILWGETPTEQGYPIQEFRINGVDHAWLRFYNGTQTSADSFMVSKFGSHPERPWTTDFVGRGCAYAIVTCLWDREVFNNGRLDWLFEPGSLLAYDFRKDSTNGGSGSHRWGVPSTYEPTLNPVVATYNIIRGIYYGSEWVYGGYNLPAFRLPSASWIAAANECDRAIPLEGGGSQPQYRCGMEIDVDIEPLTVIEELLKSCNGRLSEIGGIFEIMVGAPGAAVYSFTDSDIIITRNQSLAPSPGLQNTYNGIEAQAPLPAERWISKAAPARYNPTWEAEDGGRRLATGLTLRAIPYPVQVQYVMESLIRDERRWRVHSFCLPPDAWSLTGSCVVNWTSERNGYSNKKFLVVRIDGEPGMLQVVTLREIDPSDYDWNTSLQLPTATGVMTYDRPVPQEVTGFQVFPDIMYDNNGVSRRPTIRIEYDGNMPDIRAVSVLVRLPGASTYDFEAEVPFAVPYALKLNGVFNNATEYLVSIKYVPFSARPTNFTEEQSVTTYDIKLGPLDIEIGEIRDEVLESVSEIDQWTRYTVREEVENAREQIKLNIAGQLTDYDQRLTINRSLVAESYANKAAWTEDILAATGPDSAIVISLTEFRAEVFDPITGLPAIAAATNAVTTRVNVLEGEVDLQATLIDLLEVSYADVSADGLLSIDVGIAPSGVSSRVVLSSRATAGGATASAAMMLDARSVSGVLTSEVLLVGGRVSLVASTSPSATKRGLLVVSGDNVYIDNARIINLTATNIDVASLTATAGFFDNFEATWAQIDNAVVNNFVAASANIGDLTVNRIKILDGAVTDFPQSSGPATSPLTQVVTYSGAIFAAPPGPFIIAASISSAAADPGVYTSYFGVRDQVTGVLTTVISAGRILNFAGVLGGMVSGRNYRFEIQATFNPSGGGNNAWSHSDWYMAATIPRK